MCKGRTIYLLSLGTAGLLQLVLAQLSHAQDAPDTQPQTPSFRVGYDPDHGAYISSLDGRWELNPYGMVQLQNVTLWPSQGDAQTGFAVRAAKLILHGHVLSKTITYHLQLNAGDGKVAAEDVYLQWEPTSYLQILAGQNEVPFNRQHITLEAYQQFVERSSVDARFNLQRDIGIQVRLADAAQVVEWTSGIWNGARQNSPNDNGSYMVTSRLAFNPWGPIAFREADLANSAEPRLSIAIADAYNPARPIAAATPSGATTGLRQILQAVFETTLRYQGVSFTTETHVRSQTPAATSRLTDYGQLIQLGIFFIPEHGELVGRVGLTGGDRTGNDTLREVAGGANWYLHAHRFKLQGDYSNLRLASGIMDHRARLQVEFFL